MPRLVAFYLREFSGRADGEVSWLYKFIFCLCLPFVSNTFYRARLIALAIAECTESVAQIDRVLDMITASDSSSGATISIERTNEDYFTVFGESANPEPPVVTFTISPQVITSQAAGGSYTIQVMGGAGQWTHRYPNHEWVQTRQSPTTLEVTVLPNSTTSPRSQVISLYWTNPATGIQYMQELMIEQAATGDATGTARIRGFVFDRATGNPIVDQWVSWYLPGNHEYRWTYTGSDGSYMFETPVSRSTYNTWDDMSIRVFRSVNDNDRYNFSSTSVPWETITSSVLQVPALYLGRSGESFDIACRFGVFDQGTSQPIAGAIIRFTIGSLPPMTGVSNSQGSVYFTPNITEAEWLANRSLIQYTASASGYNTSTVRLTLYEMLSFDLIKANGIQVLANLVRS